jgi:hypothetical protein
MTSNRRQFSRIHFQTDARLFLSDSEYPVEVIDLSLKGALIRPEGDAILKDGTACTLKIRLDTAGTAIRMEATVAHHLGHFYGLVCREIDLDSVTHLRRLVALNLGDEDLLERELALLSKG